MASKVKMTCLRSVKNRGKWHMPGDAIELTEEMAAELSKYDPPAVGPFQQKVIVVVEETPASGNDNSAAKPVKADVVELFMGIDEMEESFAEQLFDMDIDTIEKLKACTKETLIKVNGIGDATAEKLLVTIDEVEEVEE